MACCEKCWGDAYIRTLLNSEGLKTQADHYRDLLEERKDTPCSESEQHGQRDQENQ
jgi:hypothetical protein